MIEEQGQVMLDNATAVFRALRDHMMEEGIVPQVDDNACFAFEYAGNRLRIEQAGDALMVRIHALSDNVLYFIKESVVQHIADLSPAAADTFCWQQGSAAADIPPNFQALTLLKISQPSRGMRRLTCLSPNPLALTQDGMHVKLLLPPANRVTPVWPSVSDSGRTLWPRGADKLHVRYYTLRAVRPESGEVDIDVVVHAGGKMSDWSATARMGDQIGIMGPGGGVAPPVSNDLWLIGDSTALPAIARILETLDSTARGRVICGMADPTECQDYLPPTSLEVHVLKESEFRQSFSGQVLEALASSVPAFLWFGGEQTQYRALKELCEKRLMLPADRLDLSSYWKQNERYDAS